MEYQAITILWLVGKTVQSFNQRAISQLSFWTITWNSKPGRLKQSDK